MDWKDVAMICLIMLIGIVLAIVLTYPDKSVITLQDLNSSLQGKADKSDLNALVLALQAQNGAGLQCLQKYAYCQQDAYNANADLNGTPVIAFTETCVLPKGSD